MTAAEKAKAAGLPGLAYITEQTGVGRSTLDQWHKQKVPLFEVLLIGCQSIMRDRRRLENVDRDSIRQMPGCPECGADAGALCVLVQNGEPMRLDNAVHNWRLQEIASL